MKRIVILLIYMCLINLIGAQRSFRYSLDGIKKVRIKTPSFISIKGVDRLNEMEFYLSNQRNTEYVKTSGLKSVYFNGKNNLGIGLEISRQGETLTINDLTKRSDKNGLILFLPKNLDLAIDSSDFGDVRVENYTGEIEVKCSQGRLDLINVSGPIVAETDSSDINVIIDNLNQENPSAIYSYTGNITVSLSKIAAANVSLNSDLGSVHSEFDISSPEKRGLKAVGQIRELSGALNNGGVNIRLYSTIGNVYLIKND